MSVGFANNKKTQQHNQLKRMNPSYPTFCLYKHLIRITKLVIDLQFCRVIGAAHL